MGAAGLSMAAGTFSAAWAGTPLEEAQTLVQQGDLDGALSRLDRYLASSPQDAEARFTRGLVLVKLNRTQDGIKAFSDLTRDYPQLPEPYNNLAVLYAQQGDYEKARDALEAALATHPAYATAHENLGDIYAALAGASYNRALALDQANQGVRYKLSLINQLGNGPGAPTATTKPSTSVEASGPGAPTAVDTTKLAMPNAPAAPLPPTPAAPAASRPQPAGENAPSQQAASLLSGWAKAWSSKDTEGYLSYYAPDFQPESGLSRSDWEAQRRARIAKPSHISVRVLNPEVTPLDDRHVRVSFIQDYQSDSINDKVSKIVELHDVGGSWKIAREYIR
jgi:tetratricopeptide (TPR) repeat protein